MGGDLLEMGDSGPSRFRVVGFKIVILVAAGSMFCVTLSSVTPKPLLKA